MPARTMLLILLSVLSAAGCGGGAAPDSPGSDRAGPDPSELERLRGLPYVGSAPSEDRESGVLILDRERSYPGYTLYAVQMLSLAELIDESGEVVRSWGQPDGGRWERAELLPNGDLLVVGADRSGSPGAGIPDEARYVLRLDWEGRLLWKRQLNAHHDIERLPGGELLALTFRRRRLAAFPGIDTRDDLLTLLDPEGRVLEELSLLDAFARRPDVFRLKEAGRNTLGVAPWLDLFHSNSVESIDRPDLAGTHPVYEPGNVLICLRHQNCVAVVNRDRRELVWAWGDRELLGPHDARLLDNGNILVFDNGMGRGWSRVVEVDPREGRIVWEYRASEPADFYTLSKGSSQRLPNGNTLIAESDRGRAFEVTGDGKVVWLFACPHEDGEGNRAAIVRAVRYERELVGRIMASGG